MDYGSLDNIQLLSKD